MCEIIKILSIINIYTKYSYSLCPGGEESNGMGSINDISVGNS